MDFVTDLDLENIIENGNVILIKIDEVGSQLSNLKKELKEYSNVKLILENGRNIRAIHQAMDQGKVPVLLLGRNSLNNMTIHVEASITHVFRTSKFISEEAADMFIF